MESEVAKKVLCATKDFLQRAMVRETGWGPCKILKKTTGDLAFADLQRDIFLFQQVHRVEVRSSLEGGDLQRNLGAHVTWKTPKNEKSDK